MPHFCKINTAKDLCPIRSHQDCDFCCTNPKTLTRAEKRRLYNLKWCYYQKIFSNRLLEELKKPNSTTSEAVHNTCIVMDVLTLENPKDKSVILNCINDYVTKLKKKL